MENSPRADRLLQKIEQGERNILAIPLLTYINKA